MLRLWRPLALIAFFIALWVQPAFAHGHLVRAYHAAYRHYSHHRKLAWHHRKTVREHRRFVLRARHRNVYAFAPAYLETRSATQSEYGFGPSPRTWRRSNLHEGWQQENSWQQNAWRQQNSWQQNSVSHPSSGGYAETYSAPYGRSRRHGEGWTSRWSEQGFGERSQLQSMAAAAASANGIPVSLVDRVIKRESGGNPRAISRGNYGLMQIRLGTARAMGYSGSAAGLLNASTNMAYGVRYLAGAYRAAGGNESRAVALYARGYRAAPRVQYASYYGARPQRAAFSDGAYYDSFTRRIAVRRVRHYRHRAM